MIFNYIRVSTVEQNTERQLKDIACDRIYEEKISGKDTNRPQLQAMLSNIRSEDIINIHEMSRLARNTRDLLNLVEEITSKGATVVFHKENLTFKGNEKQDPYQKMMMTMLGAVAELERSILLERQREGIAVAKSKGKYKGGKMSSNRKKLVLYILYLFGRFKNNVPINTDNYRALMRDYNKSPIKLSLFTVNGQSFPLILLPNPEIEKIRSKYRRFIEEM